MLLLPDALLVTRREIAKSALAPLADSLAAELAPLMGGDLYVPAEKALLSREGGRCANDGTTLEFLPFAPHEHRCPTCGTTYRGELHDRAWVYPYQLWLAERAVHASLLFLLRGSAEHGQLARDILRRYADAYLNYPNRDNVLGPTRLFFSTYLESIWLLQICVAADLMEAAGDHAIADVVRDRIAQPSRAIITPYDEGFSNRQVWNNAALIAAARLLGDQTTPERLIRSESGVEAHLAHGLLKDGTWYEGENYHLFAHRGLWYGVTMAEMAGIAIAPELVQRFQEGFATPFATALPDFTLPSRKDSQYAISLRQSRFAELCELGLSRDDDARLVSALARLYADDIPAGDTGRARSSADVERNMPPSRLSRADLSWRSLLHARAELPALTHTARRSAHLEGQGITVFRRDAGDVYVALDWGQSGGGHGHPDRLNVLFSHGETRWLDDLGTGSYVDPSLHWYRSTLAHNAPFINGHSQQRVSGALLAHDERGGVGWVLAQVNNLAPGVHAQRALIVTPDYFIDELTWAADAPARFELPIHFEGTVDDLQFQSAPLDGGDGPEDGFAFVNDVHAASLAAMEPLILRATNGTREARGWVCANHDAEIFHAVAPGQPASRRRPFYVLRCQGTGGVIRSVWAWSDRVTSVAFTDTTIEIALPDGTHRHQRTDEYWQMEIRAGAAQSGIELYGWREARDPDDDDGNGDYEHRSAETPLQLHRGAAPVTIELGEPHYRRSEETWEQAGRPTATVALAATADALVVDVRVVTPAALFVAADAVNRYDNEHPDINGHGIQLYVRTPWNAGAWVVVPNDGSHTARVRPISGWGTIEMRSAEWAPNAEGFEVRVTLPLPPSGAHRQLPIALDLLVNETANGRERRRGQLVLSGASSEFVYLRGDRHDPGRLVPVVVTG